MNLHGVIIVDDHRLFRSSLKFLLESTGKYKIIGEASNGIELMDLLTHTSPELIIMDISMPGMNGIEATRQALLKYPSLKILILSMFGEPNYYNSLIDFGIKGFLLKDANNDDFFNAADRIIKGETYFSQELLLFIIKDTAKIQTVKLSHREKEVLSLISRGLSNTEIAQKLSLSQRTVERHRTNLLDKTGSKNSIRLMIYALKNNLISI
jgi:DNA-binding NarL/FixJ family response regulator